MESELGLKGDESDSYPPPDTKKTQKQCLIKKSNRAKSPPPPPPPSPPPYYENGTRYRDFNTLLNVVLCLLCGISVSFSGYFSYREIKLEGRLHVLELELAQKFNRLNSGMPPASEIFIERMKREMEQRFQQKLNRELSNGRRLLASTVLEDGTTFDDHFSSRRPRDVSDCVCRPGKKSHPILVLCHPCLTKKGVGRFS